MVSRTAALVALAAPLVLCTCQGKKRDRDDPGPVRRPAGALDGSGSAGSAGSGAGSAGPAPVASGGSGALSPGFGAGSAGPAPGAGPGSRKTSPPDEPEAPDPGKQIAELGAIPAWQAVIDRAQLLARRGQKGVVYGRVGPAVVAPAPAPASPSSDGGVPVDAAALSSSSSPYVWLVDDTEGNGSLGIRLSLGKLSAKEGDRVAVTGAWELDADRRWYWKAEALQPLAPPPPPAKPPAAPVDPPSAVPGHVPAAAPLPPGGKLINQAKDNDLVYFQLVGPTPAREGDGWLIGTQPGAPPSALLILPGERPSYGGQDMRTPDERWQLKRQTNYWLRIGKLRPQGAGKPPVVNARTAPVRVM